jgi:hypothetical protein
MSSLTVLVIFLLGTALVALCLAAIPGPGGGSPPPAGGGGGHHGGH